MKSILIIFGLAGTLALTSCHKDCDDPVADCICTYEYNPVCGSDGKTYSNPCAAECSGVTYTEGTCEGDGGNGCICPAVYDPVCGEDGNTYGNACEASCAGVASAPGECLRAGVDAKILDYGPLALDGCDWKVQMMDANGNEIIFHANNLSDDFKQDGLLVTVDYHQVLTETYACGLLPTSYPVIAIDNIRLR